MYFIRHGKIIKKVKHIFIGRESEPLCQEGINDISEKCQDLKKLSLKKIYTSPCVRAIQTAEIISNSLNIPFEIADELDEWHLSFRRVFLALFCLLTFKSPLGVIESKQMVHERQLSFLKKVTLEKEDEILVVTHGLFLKLLFTYLTSSSLLGLFKKSTPRGGLVKFNVSNTNVLKREVEGLSTPNTYK